MPRILRLAFAAFCLLFAFAIAAEQPKITTLASDAFAALSGADRQPHEGPELVRHLAQGASFEGVVSADRARRRDEAIRVAAASAAQRAAMDEARPSSQTSEIEYQASLAMARDAEPMSMLQEEPDGAARVLLPLLTLRIEMSALPPVREIAPEPEPSLPPAQPSATALPPTAEPPSPEPTEPTISYWRDAYPIIQRECATCHYRGGIGPFALESYAEAFDASASIRWAVEEGVMPPLPADPHTSAPFDDPRIMSDQDRETLISWVDAGAPEGDPADAPDLPPVEAHPYGEADLSFDIGVDYSPPGDEIDDYRCFVIDPGFRRDTEITMVDLEQTSYQMFHHGILFLAEPEDVDAVERMDRADSGPGYSCFGGAGFDAGPWLTGEAVGSMIRPYPAGTAKVIPAGSKFVLQLHYNTLNGVFSDRTKVKVWTADSPINKAPRDYYLVNFLFNIPPGDPDFETSADLDIARNDGGFRLAPRAKAGWLWRVWGHMHLLGDSFALDLIRADGQRERLLDIPAWDFNWQGSYDLIDPIRLEPGDRIEMTCVWDNSPENQPFVDGEQIDPRRVRWGEGTLDEMCLGGVTITDD